ncbi:MAG: hypothetical protein M3474_04835, partial [Actinomycetota bacterium]|nr:hypothetical protein [Actinomycetota bacterium]
MLGFGADRRGRRAGAAAALVAAGLLTGCAGGISSERAAGGYVRSDLGITVVPAAERADAPTVAGESVDGGRVA